MPPPLACAHVSWRGTALDSPKHAGPAVRVHMQQVPSVVGGARSCGAESVVAGRRPRGPDHELPRYATRAGCFALGCVIMRVCRASICVNAVKLMLLLTDKIYSFVFDHTDASVTPRTPPAPHGSRQRATSSHLEPPHASTAPPATDVTLRVSHSTRPCATTRLPPPPPPLLPAGRRLRRRLTS